MPYTTDDLRIKEIRELTPPSYLIREFPCGQLASSTVHIARHSAHDIIHGKDDRLLVIVGPCSIHDPVAAEEYAEKLSELRRHFADDLEIIMRVYFEKPRTTIGWKGLINDPDLDCSFHINHGLRLAREPSGAKWAPAARLPILPRRRRLSALPGRFPRSLHPRACA